MSEWREIERRKDVKFDVWTVDVECPTCGKKRSLFWNGGELDEWTCCGLRYQLEHGPTDLVIYEQREEGE